ncbi:head GIN domain-containing protein [Pontixanthobacter gangjinensis]|uniref:Putative auto-transporter adhesin head GIN domain-containing protein n=1 Tax=Christiangramia aestuarii TaxID=1028746 RepID=A0A7K1LNX4_9FLAO|nr:DUF2807 domain-containing protein [Christiangramia aestuarii]MUP42512.1 hypothetical protein [Christiangramia aestuarii]
MMLKKLPLLLLIIFISCKAQDKVKGSRNVKTEQYDINSFHSIQAKGDFKIGILKGSKPMIEIEADDNLHDLIQTDVVDGVLLIKPIKEIKSSKRKELRITFADTLKNISIAGEVELSSLQDLYLGDFDLTTRKDAQAFLTLTAKTFNLVQSDDAKSELNITASKANWQLNQSSEVKALVNAPVFNVDIYEKASARIDGDVQEFKIRADQSSKFDGENLTSIKADVLAQGDSEVKVNATESLKIKANGKSEIDIYNEPVIELIEFKDEASLVKKEFSKGLFN